MDTYRLAVDIGGTFTDIVLLNNRTGEWKLNKILTRSSDLAAAVIEAVDQTNVPLSQVVSFIHGTTLGLNTLLEHNGCRVGLITNAGFEDVLAMGRYNRARRDMYSLVYRSATPLVSASLRRGIHCRRMADDTILEPLSSTEVIEVASDLIHEQKVDAIAVCLLHAYKNPSDEIKVKQIINERWPDVSVSISSDIVREYREFERTQTTCVNAYIQPIFRTYLTHLESGLRKGGFTGKIYITRSGGGALTPNHAIDAPVETILSGPAGGIVGAISLAKQLPDHRNLVTIDVGGTSTDACIIQDGEPVLVHQSSVDGRIILTPSYDIKTLGAGGGTIATADKGRLRVGPRSAGASPGPICYGLGGTKPTFTDAATILGYFDTKGLLGGRLPLDLDTAIDIFSNTLSKDLDLPVEEVARGIFEIELSRTATMIRELTIEKGLDPRDFELLAFGGAGPVFTPLVARELGSPSVVVPRSPSVFSAWGMLMVDFMLEKSTTFLTILEERSLKELEAKAADAVLDMEEELRQAGFGKSASKIIFKLALRYFQQEYTLDIPYHIGARVDEIIDLFLSTYEARYGHRLDDKVQLVHIRCYGVGINPPVKLPTLQNRSEGPELKSSEREAYCFSKRKRVPFKIYQRDDLLWGDRLVGPAIIEEQTSTTVFYSDQVANVDELGNIIIERL